MAEVEVHHIPEDSIVLLRDVKLPESDEAVRRMMDDFRAKIGHERFVILVVMDYTGAVEVLRAGDSLPEWILAKLAESEYGEQRRSDAYAAGPPSREPMKVPASAILGSDDEEAGVESEGDPDAVEE